MHPSNQTVLEKERKFRIDGFDTALIPAEAVRTDVVQTYLLSKDGTAERVRARGDSNDVFVFTHTIKEPRSPGVSVEQERIISHLEYTSLLAQADIARQPIHKTRWCFSYKGQYCELDVFKGKHEGLVMLEIEYDGDPESVEPPPFLGTVTDVTDNSKYSNYSLAKAV